MYYINIMSDIDDNPDISRDLEIDTPISEEIPDSPKEVKDVIESEDELEGDKIPVIEDEDIDDTLQEEKVDIDDNDIELQTSNLKEFNTDFNPDDLLLLVLLENDKYIDYLGVITDISDDYIVLNDERNIYYTEGFIQLIHKDYNVIDIIKIVETDINILEKDEIFKEPEIELDLIVKDKKEKIYNETEIKEDFISSVIGLHGVYDNEYLIKNITEMVYEFIDLIDINKYRSDIDDTDILYFLKKLLKDDKLDIPSFIVPIVGMKKKIFDEGYQNTDNTISTSTEEELIRKYNILNDTDDFSSKGYINYMNNLFSDDFESYINNPQKYGFIINHVGNVLRDCLSDINPCNSVSGKYIIDLLKIRKGLDIIHNNEIDIIVDERNINIIGFLLIPLIEINNIYIPNLYNSLYSLNDILHLYKQKNLTNILKSSTIYTEEISESTTNTGYDQDFKKYLFDNDKQLTFNEFKQVLKNNLPTTSDIFDSLNILINEDEDLYLFNLINNYDDMDRVLQLLNMKLEHLNKEKKEQLNRKIENNNKEYEKIYNKLLKKFIKPIKPLKTITKQLDTKEKIKLSLELIFSQRDLKYRYSLLSKFISIYGRDANKENEDKSFYYNKSVDSEKLLCKHYLYLIQDDKNVFDSMLSLYGEESKDGNIYCKKCSRFICKSDFSTFEGISDGIPNTSKEISQDIEDALDLEKKEVKESYDLIKNLSEKFNINLKNDDMKNIIDLYLLLNHKNLYDFRYETDISKLHPILKEKSSLALKEYLCNINNILSVIFLIFIQIQISNNSYNINFNNRINLINSDESWKTLYISSNENSINRKVLNYIESKLKFLVRKYPKEQIFININDLFEEIDKFKTLKMTFSKHFINVMRYWLNPQYNLHSQLEKYFLFESGINKDYIHDYWVNYKPLYDNKLVKHINNYVQSNNELYQKYFINSIQNISLLKPISNDEPKYMELDIKLSELMNNPSFKRMYQYALKGYGKSPVLPILNLLTNQFVNTFTPSQKKDLISLLHKCNFNNERGEYSSITFKSIKNVFLREIINLDIKKDFDNIRKFQYINLNNHEYFLLNSYVIKFYTYNPSKVYITDNYDTLLENDAPILEKMFKYYCLNKQDELIPNRVKYIGDDIINTNMINYFLLDFNEDLIENISECNKEVPKTQEYFHMILNYLINKNKLYLTHNFIQYTENYSNQFIINNINKNIIIEERLSDFTEEFCDDNDEIYNDINNINELIKSIIFNKDKNILIDYSDIKTKFNHLMNNLSHKNKIYIKNLDELFNRLIEIDIYSQFNQLQKDNFNFKLNRKEKTLLEESVGFIPETNIVFFINKISEKLNDKIVSDRMIHNIFYRISFLKNTQNGNFNAKIHKDDWKMSESKIGNISDYLSINTFLLHNDIFFKNKISEFETGRKYSGFNQYRKKYYNIYFEDLYNYINRYRIDLYKLKTGSGLFETGQEILNRFIFLFIINKICEYINLLIDENSKEYFNAKKRCDLIDNTDITIKNNILILSRFLLDIITDVYDKLYDSEWIYIDKTTYRNKLDEHNAREKQQNLDKLDHMTDDKRRLYSVQQKITVGVMYKESEKANLQRIIGGEKDQQTIEERIEKKKELYEDDDGINQLPDVLEEPDIDDDGYYDHNDFEAEGDEDEDNLDALQHNQE